MAAEASKKSSKKKDAEQGLKILKDPENATVE